MKKVLIFPGKIAHYRVPLYNALGAYNDFEVHLAYFGNLPGNANEIKCKLVKLNLFQIGPVQFNWNLLKLYKDFDMIISGFTFLRPVSLLIFFLSQKPFIWWGIGLGNNELLNRLRVWLVQKSDGLITYMPNARDWYIRKGIQPEKISVAGNTVYIRQPQLFNNQKEKSHLLLLGSLNERKKFEDVFQAFSIIKNEIPTHISIMVVGDGVMRARLEHLAKELNIHERVIFKGKINDEERLVEIFKQSLVSISPGQAGLSILHCFAFGVPFIAYKNAISGGELENILPEENGLLTDPNVTALSEAIKQLLLDNQKLEQMSKNAFRFYTEERTMEKMAGRFQEVITKNLQMV